MIYPSQDWKSYWDMFMALILLISCVITPLEITFGNSIEKAPSNLLIFDYVTDIFFFMDIIIIFNTALITDDYYLIEDRKEIA